MPFIRSLSPEFIAALNDLYQQRTWWTHLADDRRVFIGIRNETLNVYVNGGSIGRLTFDNNSVHLHVHGEYLSLPSSPTYIDVVSGQAVHRPLVNSVDSYLGNFQAIIGRVRRFAGKERFGENRIATRCDTVIDIEAAFTTDDENEPMDDDHEQAAGRIDMVCLRGNTLLFWEIKDYKNSEIRATGEPEVCGQLHAYTTWLSDSAPDIANQYAAVLSCYRQLHGAFFTRRRLDAEDLIVDEIPRLLIFGFDADQYRTLRDSIVPNIVESTAALVPQFSRRHIRLVGNPRNVTNDHLR